MLRLTKLKENKPSIIAQDASIVVDEIQTVQWDGEQYNKVSYSYPYAEVGSSVLAVRGIRDWIETSTVKNILEECSEYVVFETQTSIYKLEKVDNA